MRRRLLLLLFAACLVGAVAHAPLLTAAGSFLVVRDVRRPGDAIVVLSGSTPDRVLEAVDLYREGMARRVVLTRGHPPPGIEALRAQGGDMQEPHEVNASIAAQLGVPREAIRVVGPGAGSTATEAEAVIRYLRQENLRSILLVTSKLHTRRAAWIFRTLAGGDLEFVMCPSRYDPFDPGKWWRSRAFTRRVVIEYEKMVVFLLRDWWRPRESGKAAEFEEIPIVAPNTAGERSG